MAVRSVSRIAFFCLLNGVALADSALGDDHCRLSRLSSVLEPGQQITVEPIDSTPVYVSYLTIDETRCVLLAAMTDVSPASERRFALQDLGRIRYEKRGRFNPATAAIATLGGVGIGAMIGAIVGPVSDPTSDIRYPQSDKGPVAGAIAGGVVGLAAGTIIPLVLKRTYVIEF